MNNIAFKIKILSLMSIFILSTIISTAAMAADDPSIKGTLRRNITASMNQYIESRMVGDIFYIYDTVEGKLLRLKLDKLHEGIVKKGDFYVSCADFFDSRGQKIDLDFLVIDDGGNLKTVQAVIHAKDGSKRKYHLEG